jgi:hypothetical protein
MLAGPVLQQQQAANAFQRIGFVRMKTVLLRQPGLSIVIRAIARAMAFEPLKGYWLQPIHS